MIAGTPTAVRTESAATIGTGAADLSAGRRLWEPADGVVPIEDGPLRACAGPAAARTPYECDQGKRRRPVRDPRRRRAPVEPPSRRRKSPPIDEPAPDEPPLRPPEKDNPPVKEPPRRRRNDRQSRAGVHRP